MYYIQPLMITHGKLSAPALTQATGGTPQGLVPGDDACPDIRYNERTGTGTINMSAEYQVNVEFGLTSQQTCSIIVSTSGQATFVDNVLQVDCTQFETSCQNDCQNVSSIRSIEVCLTSLIRDGQNETPDPALCQDLTEAQYNAIVAACNVLDR